MSKTTTNNIALGLGASEFTIDGDKDKKIYLYTNDMGIIGRIQETVPKINELESKYVKLYLDTSDNTKTEDEQIREFSDGIKSIDADLRDCINYIFDYDVCSVILPSGTMVNLKDGEYIFSIIVSSLLELYSDTIVEETEKLVAKMKKRADKYVNRDHKKKGTK